MTYLVFIIFLPYFFYNLSFVPAAISLQSSLLHLFTMEAAEAPIILSCDINDTEIARRNDLEIVAAVDEALNSL